MTVIDNLFYNYYEALETQGKGGDAFLIYSMWVMECLKDLLAKHNEIPAEYVEVYDAASQWLAGDLPYDQLEQCFYNLNIPVEPAEDAVSTCLFALLGEGDGVSHVEGESRIAFLLASNEEEAIEMRMNHYFLLMQIADEYFKANESKT